MQVSSKSPLMYWLMIGSWLAVTVASLPFFLDLVTASQSPVAALGRVAIALCLVVFWLFGSYNIAVTVFGYLAAPRVERVPYASVADAVAIVYPTFNDFSADHLERSMRQSHPETATYILDDSTDADVIAAIDAFAATHDVSVIRREGRQGFKAGALNYALAHEIDEPYFALMDADELLPPDFIETTLTYVAGEEVGFVQGNHDYNRETATRFARSLGIGVDVHWDVYQPPRNRYGFVMLLGHGALIRRDVWAAIGGFPEIVSEDLAFATRAREHGYFGVFAPDVDCREDFPVDYEAFRQRHKKWTAGSIEYISTELPRYLRSRAPTLTEKLDVLIPTLQLPLTGLFVAYILVVGLLTIFTGRVVPEAVAIPHFLGLVTIVTLLSPLYCYIIGIRHRPRKLVHFLAVSTTVYCSVAITAVAHGLHTLLPWKHAEFLTTPKRATSVVHLQSYAVTVFVGLLTLAMASQVGVLVGTAALTWVLAPAMAIYNNDTPAGEVVRGVSLIPLTLLVLGVGYGVVIFAGLAP